MIYYLNILFNLIIFNTFILKIFFVMFFIFGIRYLRTTLYTYIITIERMRINFMFFYIFNTILFISFYIFLLGYWRFLNTSKNLDLKILIFRIYNVILINNIYDTMLLFICIILFIIFLYYLFKFFKKYYIYHFLKIDIFLAYISQDENDPYKRNNHDKFGDKLLDLNDFFRHNIVYKFLDYLCELYLNYYDIDFKTDLKFLSTFKSNIKNKLNIPKLLEKFPIYLIIFSILYDILYNDMILHKFYYISFFLFFYYLIQRMKDLVCALYSGDSIFIYRYLYEQKELDNWTKEEKRDRIEYINDWLSKITERFTGKYSYPLDYDENRLIRLSWSTYLFIITVLIILYIFYFKNVQIMLNQEILNNITVILCISVLLIILWIFVNNRIIENVFLLFTGIVIIFGVALFLRHNIPLLFNETLIEISNIKIINNYTIEEKIIYVKEYFMFKMQYLDINQKLSLLKIIRNIPLYDLLQSKTIMEIKEYIDNMITTHGYMENNRYFSLKEYIQEKHSLHKEENIGEYILIITITLIFATWKIWI